MGSPYEEADYQNPTLSTLSTGMKLLKDWNILAPDVPLLSKVTSPKIPMDWS